MTAAHRAAMWLLVPLWYAGGLLWVPGDVWAWVSNRGGER